MENGVECDYVDIEWTGHSVFWVVCVLWELYFSNKANYIQHTLKMT